MRSEQMSDRYTMVGPGTPASELVHGSWHPVAAVSQMNDRWTKRVRLLGEDLILNKDRSGTFALIEPHRAYMMYGIPAEHSLRCPYHGWLHGEADQHTEQSHEEPGDADARMEDQITMTAYPVHVKAGIIFAYLDPSPAR